MSTLITAYLGQGLAAARPATPTIATGAIGYYFATDTGALTVYANGAWGSVTAASLPPTYWNILDCGDVGYCLAPDYLTACGNGTNGSYCMMRATPARAPSGKFYVEFLCATTGNYSVVGLVTPAASLNDYPGNTVGWGVDSSGATHAAGGGSVTSSTPAWGGTPFVTIAMAIDFGAGTIQFYKNNVAGALISGITFSAASYNLAVAANGPVNRYTLRTQASNQKYAAPAGFTPWG